MYTYKCKILRIVDGDTIDAEVDLGFRVRMEMRFRLLGINSPERFTEAGKRSSERLAELCPVGQIITVETKKDKQEKFGRYLGLFFTPDGTNVNQTMISEGHGVRSMD